MSTSSKKLSKKVADLLPPYSKGSQVWCPHPDEGWCLREVLGNPSETTIEIIPSDAFEKKDFTRLETTPFDPSHRLNIDDIAQLSALHEAPLLDLLRRRYFENTIYTCTSDILISINPYKNIEGLYDLPDNEELKKRVMRARGEQVAGDEDDHDYALKPHVFTIGHQAYTEMVSTRISQSVLVSGESGAGKTEATKKIIKYLAAISNMVADGTGQQSQVEEFLLAASPLLESLGNARTLFNDNSSRFGKFIRIRWNKEGVMNGSTTEAFMLEKSRVTGHEQGETTFHIMYQLTAAADGVLDQKFLDLIQLQPGEDYAYCCVDGVCDHPIEEMERDIENFKHRFANRRRNFVQIIFSIFTHQFLGNDQLFGIFIVD